MDLYYPLSKKISTDNKGQYIVKFTKSNCKYVKGDDNKFHIGNK